MYEMYPDSWGPATHRHHREDGYGGTIAARVAVQTSLDLRDNGGERPDDN